MNAPASPQPMPGGRPRDREPKFQISALAESVDPTDFCNKIGQQRKSEPRRRSALTYGKIYSYARRYAEDARFSFGPGPVAQVRRLLHQTFDAQASSPRRGHVVRSILFD